MAEIHLELDKQLFVPKFYPYLFDYSHRWEVYRGSAGSAKSYFITQKLLVRALSEPIKILVCRRYATSIRNTVFSLFKAIIDKWKLTQFVKIRETDFNIKLPNGSEIIFLGLDEETKLLSLHDIGTIFIEEVYEVPKNIVEQLDLRMRGRNPNQQLLLAFNPISKAHWLYDFCEVNPPRSFLYLHSTYKDNPFLSDDYVATLEDLRERNPRKAQIYCDGDWGVEVDGLVITNWRTQDFDVSALAQTLEHRVGLDFGYKDATAIVPSFYDKQNKTIYVYDEFYQAGAQLDVVAQAIVNLELRKSKIVCDSAEPRSIDFLRAQGFNAVGAIKGQNSVQARIAFLQNHTIVVHPKCANTIRELENFSYIKDNKTNTYTDKTTHEFSHTIDALGYAYSDVYRQNRLGTLDKSVLGL